MSDDELLAALRAALAQSEQDRAAADERCQRYTTAIAALNGAGTVPATVPADAYAGDDGDGSEGTMGRCYCGVQTYPAGGPA